MFAKKKANLRFRVTNSNAFGQGNFCNIKHFKIISVIMTDNITCHISRNFI